MGRIASNTGAQGQAGGQNEFGKPGSAAPDRLTPANQALSSMKVMRLYRVSLAGQQSLRR